LKADVECALYCRVPLSDRIKITTQINSMHTRIRIIARIAEYRGL